MLEKYDLAVIAMSDRDELKVIVSQSLINSDQKWWKQAIVIQ